MNKFLFLFLFFIPSPLKAGIFPTEIRAALFHTSEKKHLLENSGGIILEKGINSFLDIKGGFSSRNLSLHYLLRNNSDREKGKTEIRKAYLNLILGKWILEAGKNNAEAGPGVNKLLLSRNAHPYLLVSVKNRIPLELAGRWRLFALNAWLNEKRRDINNPRLFIVRISYSPLEWIEIGGIRSTLYGGDNRPGYKIWDYPALLLGKKENITNSRWDNDGYAAYDIILRLPKNRLPSNMEKAEIYYQDAGTDISAFWQEEDDKFYWPLGFKLRLHAYLGGIFLKFAKNSVRIEFTSANPMFYIHHWYSYEGYSYRGASLGLPYGRNSRNLTFTHCLKLGKSGNIEYRIGFLKQPAFNSAKAMKRYYAVIKAGRSFGSGRIEMFLRGDKTNNYDTNPEPNQYILNSTDRKFLTAGMSYTLKI